MLVSFKMNTTMMSLQMLWTVLFTQTAAGTQYTNEGSFYSLTLEEIFIFLFLIMKQTFPTLSYKQRSSGKKYTFKK